MCFERCGSPSHTGKGADGAETTSPEGARRRARCHGGGGAARGNQGRTSYEGRRSDETPEAGDAARGGRRPGDAACHGRPAWGRRTGSDAGQGRAGELRRGSDRPGEQDLDPALHLQPLHRLRRARRRSAGRRARAAGHARRATGVRIRVPERCRLSEHRTVQLPRTQRRAVRRAGGEVRPPGALAPHVQQRGQLGREHRRRQAARAALDRLGRVRGAGDRQL